MDGGELDSVLKAIGWRPQELARRLGVRNDTVYGWLTNRRPVPENLAEWLIRIRDKISDDPLPAGWEERRSSGGE